MDGSTTPISHKTARAAPFVREFTNSPWTGHDCTRPARCSRAGRKHRAWQQAQTFHAAISDHGHRARSSLGCSGDIVFLLKARASWTRYALGRAIDTRLTLAALRSATEGA